MGLFSRARELLVGRRRGATALARREEAEGRLERATALYLEAGEAEQAVRVLALRADAALDLGSRYALLGQAVAAATGDRKNELELRRARLAVELVKSGKLELTRLELHELAEKIGKLGEPTLAAEIFAQSGDPEAEARMLVQAGAIEQLENVLDREQERERDERKERELEAGVRDLLSFGRRRDALDAARGLRDGDDGLRALLSEIEQRRIVGHRARFELDGESVDVLFGKEIVVGRAGATLAIASPALSREHLKIRRGENGPEVVDLGSKNGTLLRGVRIDAPLPVGDALELALGGEVRISISPWRSGGVRIELVDQIVHAPLGPFVVAGWELGPAEDGWLELDAKSPAYLRGLRVSGKVQLIHGDAICEQAAGPPLLGVP